MQSKVVLHRTFFHSLIQLAFEEQLLNRDNFYYKRDISKKPPVPKWIENQIKQQLILTPTLITNDLGKYEGTLKGDFIEKLYYPKHSLVDIPADYLNKIDYNIVSQILELDGKNIIEEAGFKNKIVELASVYSDLERLSRDNNYPELIFNDIEAENKFRQAIGQSELVFSDDFKNKFKYRNELWDSVRDIWSCYKDIYNLLQIANKEDALVMIPLYEKFHAHQIDPITQNEDLCYLFQITCEELGTIPVPYNLKNAFMLSDTSEAIDLRVFLNHWIESLIDVNDLEIDKLKKEISNALKFLKKKEHFGNHSTLTTFLGIPATMMGFINFLMSVPGLIITLYGTYTTIQDYRIKKKYNWAMFKSRIE